MQIDKFVSCPSSGHLSLRAFSGAALLSAVMNSLQLLLTLTSLALCVSEALEYRTNATIVPGKINVHLVAHTHDDVGWLKTVDQYFLGANDSIQEAGVQYIISSVVASLLENPDRKFIYVEQAFFQRWWRAQNARTQNRVKELVAGGQLEFINGGWCMHDEATPHYIDMIDQTTLGHLHIKQLFGKLPRIGWQIDPFGHSAVQAYLLGAELGFDGLFFGRIDYQDRAQRFKDKSLEVIWRGSKSLGAGSQIFTSVFPLGYGPPDGFSYEEYNEIPVQDDPAMFDVNVKERVEDFVLAAMEQANVTRTNHVMWTMGTDFKYQVANKWFVQMDKLIHYVNKDGRVNALYSTPSLYLDAVHKANISWPLKSEDFFPYADDDNSFWTGYFTSRAALKRYVRVNSGYFQAARQLEVFVGRKGEGPNTDKLWDALSTLQHHDGVSGTEKQHVANDYAKRLAIGVEEAGDVVKSAIASLRNSNASIFLECPLLNISYCPPSESITAGKTLVITAYNGLGWYREDYLRLPVNSDLIIVRDSAGTPLQSQLVPLSNQMKRIRSVYVKATLGISSGSAPKYWLYFKAAVPPLGARTFRVSLAHANDSGTAVISTVESYSTNETSDHLVEVGFSTKLTYSTSAGICTKISNSAMKAELAFKQEYKWYAGYNGGSNSQNSGAYIFLPSNNTPQSVSEKATLTVIRGPLLEEVQQDTAPWLFQASRMFKDEEHVESEFIAGPIPVVDGVGKELISSFSTALQSEGVFYTDSNGRDFLKRIRDYRTDWKLNVTQPVAGNYYPINLGMYLKDNSTDFSVLVDRAMGGASISNGELELMLHRRLVADDSRGVGEPLDELVCLAEACEGLTVQGMLYFSWSSPEKAARWRRQEGQKVLSPLQLLFNTQDDNRDDGSKTTFSSFAEGYSLPENVAIIALQELETKQVILRLAHLYEVGEHTELSKLAKVELKKMFHEQKLSELVELSLSANQEKSRMREKLKWNVDGDVATPALRGGPVDKALVVGLGPMEIRTFELKFL